MPQAIEERCASDVLTVVSLLASENIFYRSVTLAKAPMATEHLMQHISTNTQHTMFI